MKSFYYSSDKQTFQNKLEAVKYQKETGKGVYFFYHDDVYSKIDWTVEPPGSLEFHYKQQAQRIRDEYDYVVLFYSGGYDSTNILETFYYNNIHLDKIVCVGAFKQDEFKGSDSNHNGEIYRNCFPTIVNFNLEKITQLCDYSELFDNVNNFSISSMGEQWIENVGAWFSPHNWFWRDIHKHVIPKNMENKKVALVWGKDKPNLIKYKDRFGFSFSDVGALSYAGEVNVNNIDRINFYWDPAYPLLVIKQVHELYHKKEFVDPNVLYNLKNPLRYKSPKSPSNLISLRDKFLIEHPKSSIHELYAEGILRMRDKYDIHNNPPHLKSRFYNITS